MSGIKFCPECKAQISGGSKVCNFCGTELLYTDSSITDVSKPVRTFPFGVGHVSRLWYIFPLLFAVFGGVFAWWMNRGTDPRKAERFLWLGVLVTAYWWWLLNGGLWWLMWGIDW